jgi:hypothetical protein
MQNEPTMLPNELELIKEEPVSHFIMASLLIGLYIWSQMMLQQPVTTLPTPNRPTPAENNEPESTTAEARAQTLDVVSTSDELGAIEADLEATVLDDFATELNAIDAELEAQ